jgi:hypothetical protein
VNCSPKKAFWWSGFSKKIAREDALGQFFIKIFQRKGEKE